MDTKQRPYIIAEAGINHNGDMRLAKAIIEAAAETGANAIKFQTYVTDALLTKVAKTADYQKEGGSDESQYDLLKQYELRLEDHVLLQGFAKDVGITFLSSPFDLQSIDLLEKLRLPFYKIPSSEITNIFYLEKIASLGKPLILSTGMSTLQDIENALKVIESCGMPRSKVTVLQCNTQYPTAAKDINLNVMGTIRDTCQVEIGLSDHTLGMAVPIAAAALGATVIEKHFTLDRSLPGPDHSMSMEPDVFKTMVQLIREAVEALGSGKKMPSDSEIKNIPIARKSLHLKQAISKGTILTQAHLTAKRPGGGLSPMDLKKVLGKAATEDFSKDTLVEPDHFR